MKRTSPVIRHLNKIAAILPVGTASLLLLIPVTVAAQQTSIIAPGAEVQQLADGFKFTEGPASDAKGDVYFTDQPNDRILKWSTDGKLSTFMQPCGRSNGLCFDASDNLYYQPPRSLTLPQSVATNGSGPCKPSGSSHLVGPPWRTALWACADEKNELWCIDPEGEKTVVVKDYEGKLLNGPNDIWIRPDGGIYFTDPLYKRPYWNRGPGEQGVQAVYYLSPDRKKVDRVADDLQQPNGVIGTPDGTILYVADIRAKKTYQYKIQTDGTLTAKKLFCELGSDGMTIDDEGNVYLTGKGVTVFDSTGEQIEHIAVDARWTANVCFGGKDGRTLFITASQGLFGLQMRVRGVGSQ